MLELKSITKRYRTESIETTALDDVNIHIAKGEYVAIMGPSGSGKSTLLNILGLLDAPDEGRYTFRGEDLSKYNERKFTNLRKESVGFIFQSFHLIESLSIYENIELALTYKNTSKSERKETVERVAKQVGISHRLGHYPKQLSGGQQQRAAIARAIANSPHLILADEPTGNLDSKSSDEINALLTELNAAGTTIIMVTHSRKEAENAKRIIELFDGKLIDDRLIA